MTDPIADMLTRIRNASAVNKAEVVLPMSKIKYNIAKILEQEGFVKGIQVVEADNKKKLRVDLKYVDGESVIHALKRISKPGLRQYKSFTELKPVIGGLGVSILTTSKGFMTDKQAKQLAVGGEVVCTVW
jgi:small subunit ribosomal protein S8